jgi:hypothetical protein
LCLHISTPNDQGYKMKNKLTALFLGAAMTAGLATNAQAGEMLQLDSTLAKDIYDALDVPVETISDDHLMKSAGNLHCSLSPALSDQFPAEYACQLAYIPGKKRLQEGLKVYNALNVPELYVMSFTTEFPSVVEHQKSVGGLTCSKMTTEPASHAPYAVCHIEPAPK